MGEAPSVPDVLAMPLKRAESLLQAAGISYDTEVTRSTRHFFQVDESHLYVVRQRYEDGVLHLLLVAKQVPNPEIGVPDI